MNTGNEIYNLLVRLFPITRSITGNGVRETLNIIQEYLPKLKICEVESGLKCFDWIVPDEWNVNDAYILDSEGKKIINFKQSNLHVVNYSIPVNKDVSLEELDEHLHSLSEQPDAIPYVTSYYNKTWGFCIKDKQRKELKKGKYKVFIDSTLKPGKLNYGELIIPGDTEQEVLLSTYVCHPSMANNELSGPTVTTYLARWLSSLKNRKYTYRIIFIPETIGSIVYISQNLKKLKGRVIAGFNITCVGDERGYSYLPSRDGDTLSDRIAKHVLKNTVEDYIQYSYQDRGSDERQYCSPGVDLPICSIMRSKYGTYTEYHTSLDNLDFVTPDGLGMSYLLLQKCIQCIESNEKLKLTVLCEPQLGKRGLYPNTGKATNRDEVSLTLALLAYCDGEHSLLDIANKCDVNMLDLVAVANKFKKEKLLEAC